MCWDDWGGRAGGTVPGGCAAVGRIPLCAVLLSGARSAGPEGETIKDAPCY